MADKANDMWLKVLIGFVLTLILLLFGFTARKVDKEYMKQHERHQKQQYDDIKEYLIRIDKKT